jgi:hypothetical protein
MTPNKSLEDNGGLAGSRAVGSVLMLSGFRAVPQLCWGGTGRGHFAACVGGRAGVERGDGKQTPRVVEG